MSVHSPMKKKAGFTLAEILVVVFIIGLVSALIVLRFRTPTFDATPQAQANQILRFMEIVQEQAILQPAVLGVNFQDHNYQVFELQRVDNQEAWVPLSDRNTFWKAKKIPSSLFIKLKTLDSNNDFATRIIFLPSGEVTPFELFVREENDDRSYVIKGDAAGNLTLGVS